MFLAAQSSSRSLVVSWLVCRSNHWSLWKKWPLEYQKVIKTYRPTYLWDSGDISDSCDRCDSCDSCDSSESSDSSDHSDRSDISASNDRSDISASSDRSDISASSDNSDQNNFFHQKT